MKKTSLVTLETFEKIQNKNFLHLHKKLFSKTFKHLSTDEKVIYSFINDRFSLSYKNKWVNENNEIFVIFTIEEICELINKSKPSVVTHLKKLERYRMIKRQKQGLNKPDLI